MAKKEEILHKIRVAFGNNEYRAMLSCRGVPKDANHMMKWRHFRAGKTGRA
jgi:hypothetical protein